MANNKVKDFSMLRVTSVVVILCFFYLASANNVPEASKGGCGSSTYPTALFSFAHNTTWAFQGYNVNFYLYGAYTYNYTMTLQCSSNPCTYSVGWYNKGCV